MIIDGDNYVNVANNTLIRKLNLNTVKHPKSYRLQWLNEYGTVKVIKKLLISFAINRYSGDVMCDVVLMQANHLLLGHSWQFDRRAIHDGFRNRYIIVKDGKTVIFVHLSLKQVYDDQLKLKKEY